MIFREAQGLTAPKVLIAYSIIAFFLTLLDIDHLKTKIPMKIRAWVKASLLFLSLCFALLSLVFVPLQAPETSLANLFAVITIALVVLTFGSRSLTPNSYNILEALEILQSFESEKIEAICISKNPTYNNNVIYKRENKSIVYDKPGSFSSPSLDGRLFDTKWEIRRRIPSDY